MSRPKPRRTAWLDDASVSTDVAPSPQLPVARTAAGADAPAHRRLRQRLDALQRLGDRILKTRQTQEDIQQKWARTVAPLLQQLNCGYRDMAVWLDARCTRPRLGKVQRAHISRIIVSLTRTLLASGGGAWQEELTALHDRHAAWSLAEKREDELCMLRGLLGDDAPPPEAGEEALLAALQQRMAERGLGEPDAAPAAQRRRSKPKKPTAAQLKAHEAAAALAQDADQTLRNLYRQLARALHPDREPDPQRLAEKTALMAQANAAYGARDLAALLHLMLRADVLDVDGLSNLAQERAQALDALFAEQEKALEAELRLAEDQLRLRLNLAPWASVKPTALRQALAGEVADLQGQLAMVRSDLAAMEDDAFFKRWLKIQAAAAPF